MAAMATKKMTAHKVTAGWETISGCARPEDIQEEVLLIERARQGDLDAFSFLVEPHMGQLFKNIVNITRNKEDAEDAVQETLLKAFTRIEQFRGTARFSTWLVSIGVNQALMCLRGRRRTMISIDTNESSEHMQPSLYLPEPGLNPEQQYRNTEWGEMLGKVVDTLPSGFRSVFELRYIQELSNEQAAMVLGISIAAVKTRALRARRHIGRRLARRWNRDCNSINGTLPAPVAFTR